MSVCLTHNNIDVSSGGTIINTIGIINFSSSSSISIIIISSSSISGSSSSISRRRRERGRGTRRNRVRWPTHSSPRIGGETQSVRHGIILPIGPTSILPTTSRWLFDCII